MNKLGIFEQKSPNKATLEAMKELEYGYPKTYRTVDSMFLD